jgi:hypothetical protein
MKKQKKLVAILWMITILMQSYQVVPYVDAAIPAEYKPNYKFDAEKDKIEELNVKINAKKKSWQTVEVFYFKELLKNYNTLFEYLPQSPDYKAVYEDCRIGAEELSREYDPSKYTEFYNNCLGPLNEIFKDIANKYTVKAKITANPIEWSAPHTVTFDARGSSDDASKTTIPSDNYFWYYTDAKGVEQVIGRWPIVKHTFKNEWNYVVHMTVRSANAGTDWIFDDSADVNIKVWAQAAKLIIFANGRRLKEEIAMKFTSQEAIDGLKIDGSATAPLGWRQIMKHEWTIINSNDEIVYKEWSIEPSGRSNWSPASFKIPLKSNWLYTVSLKIIDNEGNKIESLYNIVIADPIATIKVNPLNGNTSSLYWFDASTSYSVQSTLSSYARTITDEDGNEITTSKQKSFQQKFTKPGTYRARLMVSDAQWNDNEEAITLQVASTPPVPQFTFEPTKTRQKPSEFTFDASPSYDIDTKDDNDALTYEWSFSNNDNVSIDKIFDENKRILVSFKEKWKYKATLTVKDNYNQIQQITKDIDVLSTLRPRFTVRPASVKLWETTNFTIRSNKNISNYKIEYGDWKVENSTKDQYNYTYKKVGMYIIKVTAYSDNGEENTISTNVFIWDANKPLPSYTVQNKKNELVVPEWTCTDPNGDKHPAYVVERYEDIIVDGSESKNIQWWKDNLVYYFKPQNSDIGKWQQKRHKFDEVWCKYIDFTVEDVNASKQAEDRIWFFVTNAKPKLTNVVMTFPQAWGNSYGIWIGQNTPKDIVKTGWEKLAVKIDAVNASDADWSISKFKWYYYNTQDENRLLEIKYTPGNSPSTYFTIDPTPGEYRFWVEVYDNDGESSKSETILGKWPVVFFPADGTNNPDIPVITLKIDRWSSKVWEQVNLEAIASIASKRKDFATDATYLYDFDGDGVTDLTTKDNKVSYVYKTPWNYKPRVKVTYRTRSWLAEWDLITVEKWVKAGFLYGIMWNTIIVRDTSFGDIESRKFCADGKKCQANQNWLIENQTYFTKTYEWKWNYYIRYDVKDKNGNTSSAGRQIISIWDPLLPDSVGIVTLPAADKDGAVSVWKSLENKVLFYVWYSGKWDCYVDTDITRTSNGNASPDQDRDIKSCNQEALIEYNPSVDSTIARVYYQVWDKTLTKDITIKFIDYDISLSPEQKQISASIDGIMNQIGDNAPDLKSVLLNMRNGIAQWDDVSSLVLQARDILEKKKDIIPQSIQTSTNQLLDQLENKTTCSAGGCNEFKSAKTAIIWLFRTERKAEIAKIFEDIDNAVWKPSEIKRFLDKITEIWKEELNKKELDAADIKQLDAEICKIVLYHDISGTACKWASDGDYTGSVADAPVVQANNTGRWRKILKVVWIIAWIVGLWFIILVVIFALKAKKKQEVSQ